MNLYFRLILLVLVGMVVNTCSDEAIENPYDLSIEKSLYETSGWAEGSILHQNYDGPGTELMVDSAYVSGNSVEGLYEIHFIFEGSEDLDINIQKYRSDINYHFPDSLQSNSIVEVFFSGDTLKLETAAISLQPNTEDNTFTAVVNVHSKNLGSFNGTVGAIPLVDLK